MENLVDTKVEWKEINDRQIVITLCCQTQKIQDISAFFYTMISSRFFPGKRVIILSAVHTPFTVDEVEYYRGEILIEAGSESERLALLERLPFMSRELELGMQSLEHMQYILNQGTILLHRQLALVRWDLARVQQRWPKKVDGKIFQEFERVRFAISQEFRSVRQSRHLTRIVSAFYMGRLELQRTLRLFPQRRHLALKLMHAELNFPFGKKTVLGVAIALTCDREYERLDAADVTESISAIIPDVELVPGSFFVYQEWNDPIRMIYLEVQKGDRLGFDRQEIKRLRGELPVELKGHIAHLTHPLFYFRNEEEVLRHILTLSREVHSADDIPQVVASFQEQRQETLTFSIILVRPTSSKAPFLDLPEEVSCEVQMDQMVGEGKEAYVFTLTFDKRPFLRKDHAVDLLKARLYVIDVLVKLFGEIRDYNGGLMVKQNEVLEAVRGLLNRKERAHEQLLESLFYSLTPVVMQSHLQPEVVRTLFGMLLESTSHELKKGEKFTCQHLREHGCTFVLIRADDHSFKSEVERAVKALKFESLQLVSAFLNVHGVFYLGYVCFNAELSEQFFHVIESSLDAWKKMRRSQQTLRINLPRSFSSLDPRIAADRRSGILMSMLYEGLVRLDQNGKPVLAAAERLNVSNDFKTYIFTLRESHWSNGKRVTARDFEYGWKKLLTPAFKSRYVHLSLYPIRNAMRAKEGKCSLDDVGIYVRDDNHLVIELEEPTPYFLDFLTHWIFSPLYQGIDRTTPEWANVPGESYICNGPFKLAPSKEDEELRLVKNPHYWDRAAVRLEKIHISSIRDAQTTLAMFEQNELDWLGDPLGEIPAQDIARLTQEKKLRTHSGGAIHWAWYNCEQAPFTSKKMRQAFAYAIDRKELIEKALYGYGEPAMSLIPPSMKHASSPKFSDANGDCARALFKEGLEELGITKEELPTIIYRYLRLEDDEKVAHELARQWRKIFDIQVEVESIPWESYHGPSLTNRKFHLAGAAWYPITDDAICQLQAFRDISQPFNVSLWEHPAYTQLIEQSDRVLDPEERKVLLHQMEDLLLEEMPVVPLYFPLYRYMMRPGLQDVSFSDFALLDFRHAYIDEEKR